jgi:hypothetical protein
VSYSPKHYLTSVLSALSKRQNDAWTVFASALRARNESYVTIQLYLKFELRNAHSNEKHLTAPHLFFHLREPGDVFQVHKGLKNGTFIRPVFRISFKSYR